MTKGLVQGHVVNHLWNEAWFLFSKLKTQVLFETLGNTEANTAVIFISLC